MRKVKEGIFKSSMLVFSSVAFFSLLFIFLFVLREGLPVLIKIGILPFLTGTKWIVPKGPFGILPMIVGSIYVTLGSLVLAVPFALSCAIFLNEFAPRWARLILRPAIDLLAGIPSVIYGLFGLIIIVPFIIKYLGSSSGQGLLAGILVLTVMILPTITTISLDAISAVPKKYKDGSLALGSSKWQTIFKIVLPSAKTGILASIILGMGRAVGETMAVLMVIGNTALIPRSIVSPARTLTSNIVLGMGYATGLHRQALFASGVILFAMIMLLTLSANFISKRRGST